MARDDYTGRDGRRSRDAYQGRPRSGGPRRARSADARQTSGGSRGRSEGPRSALEPLLQSDMDHEPISRRSVVTGLFGVACALGVAKLADYQIVNVETYRDEADNRRVTSQTLFAKRGTIYDRNGNVLCSSVECQNVYVNPQLISDADEAVEALVDILGVDEETCREKVESDGTFAYIQRQVNQDLADELAELDIAGIEFEQTIMRVYPYDSVASQILGVVSVDNEGVSGLESYYDEVLTGVNGSIVRERARDGSYIAGGAYQKVAAQDGTDLVLTIDVDIQTAAEEAIALSVEETGATYGSVLVMDPRNGEILACCSNPTYDPTDLANASTADMNLRVVTDSYEPGSVFKTLVCGMALDMGVVTTDTTFTVPAQIQVGDDMVGDADDRDYTMTMTLREILRRSSNVGMVMVGSQIGAESFASYLDLYEIGSSSGIDFPGESMGTVRSLDEYDGSSLGSMSFGQGIAVAPIQVARAVSAIANGGVMMTPHFLQSQGGETIAWDEDGGVSTISADAAEQVTSMMVTVVEEGTGTGGAVEGYSVAGKTGTAQRASESGGYAENAYMASFIGFAPADDPRVLVYVTLDNTSQGSSAAAIPFQTVMSTALSTLGVPQSS